MPYTALKEMQMYNINRSGKDQGPAQPELGVREGDSAVKSAALRFLHDRCTGLRFGEKSVSAEMDSGSPGGRSIAPRQIPYNMEMDIDRLCLERSLERFLDTGSAGDAYCVYYCFREMFPEKSGTSDFAGKYFHASAGADGSLPAADGKNSWNLPVRIFACGLAFYELSEEMRSGYRTFYNYDNDAEAAAEFLEYWGNLSLFYEADPGTGEGFASGSFPENGNGRGDTGIAPFMMKDQLLEFLLSVRCGTVSGRDIMGKIHTEGKSSVFKSFADVLTDGDAGACQTGSVVPNLLKFAVALNARHSGRGYETGADWENLETEFHMRSLEFRLSNIRQAMAFEEYLRAIHCFCSAEPSDCAPLTALTPEQIEIIAPMEHERWINERWEMGWRYSDKYEDNTVLREQTRCSRWLTREKPDREAVKAHFASLPEEEKNKDAKPFDIMLELIGKSDGMGVYYEE